MSRPGSVVDFPSEDPRSIADTLRATLGRMASLVSWLMYFNDAGLNVIAAASTDIAHSKENFDFADAGIDQLRVQVYGTTAGGAGIAVLVYDLTNNRELCRVALSPAAGLYVGDWTKIPAKGGDATLVARVLGDGVNAQTIYSVRVQARTTRAAA